MAAENFKSNVITALVGVAATLLAPVLRPFLANASRSLPKRQSRAASIFTRRGGNHLQSWASQWMT